MSRLRERCPGCSRRLITTRFDTTFRMSDRTERLCFGIPGGLCEDCHQLYIDPELIELLDLRDERTKPIGREGTPASHWVLLDYGSVIVHIFTPPERDYYGLEKHWSEAKTILRVQ